LDTYCFYRLCASDTTASKTYISIKETEKRLKQKEEKVVADQRRADERNKKRVDYFKQKTAT
jgi:hypothetical protein